MIQPQYLTLNGLFAQRVFRVPQYQRFYSWQKRQLDDLFADIDDLYRKGGDRHHFMATLVCLRTGEKQVVKSVDYEMFEIVDGQQRISTLILMLKALQHRIEDEEERQAIGKMLVKDDGNLLLLQTNNMNQHHFNNYLRNGEAPRREDLRTHADRNFYDAVRLISIVMDKWIQAGRTAMELLHLLRNRIGFVAYDTEEKHAVYTIFECLNSRGLEVDWLDKAKSVLMGIAFEKSKTPEAASAKIDELHALWAGIYNEIARYPVPGQEILRVAATLQLGVGVGKPLAAEESIEKLKQFCTNAEKTIEVTHWIKAAAEKLVMLHTDRHLGPVTGVLQVRLLGVAILLCSRLSEAERVVAFDQWERVSFRIYGMMGKDARTKVGDYVRLATSLMISRLRSPTFDEIMEGLRSLGSDHSVEDAIDEVCNHPRYEGFEDEIRYLLWRYEEYLARAENALVNEELRAKVWAARSASETIEHIFPQFGSGVTHWVGKLGDTPWKHLDRLGNLILLPPGMNSEAGRKSFADKKKIYARAEGLRLVREVLEENDWTLTSVEAREKHIRDFLKQEFADI